MAPPARTKQRPHPPKSTVPRKTLNVRTLPFGFWLTVLINWGMSTQDMVFVLNLSPWERLSVIPELNPGILNAQCTHWLANKGFPLVESSVRAAFSAADSCRQTILLWTSHATSRSFTSIIWSVRHNRLCLTEPRNGSGRVVSREMGQMGFQ